MPLLEQTKDIGTDFQALVDRVFGEMPLLSELQFPRIAAYGTWPAFDLYEKDGKYFMEFAVPGYDPKEINVEVTGSTVTVSGSHAETVDKKEAKYHRREVRRGTFTRTLTLPEDIDAENVDATVDNGILTLTLNPVKPIQAKKIAIKGKA